MRRAQQLRGALEAVPRRSVRGQPTSGCSKPTAPFPTTIPGSTRADASVIAVAQLLTEEGRLFSDEKLLQDAIGRYESLHLEASERPLPFCRPNRGRGEAGSHRAERTPPPRCTPAAFFGTPHNKTLFCPLPSSRSKLPGPCRAATGQRTPRPSVAPSRAPPAVTQSQPSLPAP